MYEQADEFGFIRSMGKKPIASANFVALMYKHERVMEGVEYFTF